MVSGSWYMEKVLNIHGIPYSIYLLDVSRKQTTIWVSIVVTLIQFWKYFHLRILATSSCSRHHFKNSIFCFLLLESVCSYVKTVIFIIHPGWNKIHVFYYTFFKYIWNMKIFVLDNTFSSNFIFEILYLHRRKNL